MPALVALVCGVLAAGAYGFAAQAPPHTYTLAATKWCLTRLPGSVSGLPPATPPTPPALFVYALARDDLATFGIGQPPPRAHKQLGAWYGGGRYQGIILTFFGSVPDARASFNSVAGLYGGERIRNVVAIWDQKSVPSRTVRDRVFGCLRSVAPGGRSAPKRVRPATLATFAGRWGGHTRGLSITPTGGGREDVSDGCCVRVYRLTFRILSVTGTLTRGRAVYRVTSFRRYERGVPLMHAGDEGTLLLRNGIVTDVATSSFFCSIPAWGATGACGA